jgi:hypothetical protein
LKRTTQLAELSRVYGKAPRQSRVSQRRPASSPARGNSRNTDEVTGGLRLCAPHPSLDKSGDSRPGKHSH